jgi:hypothetical protein
MVLHRPVELARKPDNWSWAGEQLSGSAVLNFSGEDSLASNKVGAFRP